jgi:hypothetical protein
MAGGTESSGGSSCCYFVGRCLPGSKKAWRTSSTPSASTSPAGHQVSHPLPSPPISASTPQFHLAFATTESEKGSPLMASLPVGWRVPAATARSQVSSSPLLPPRAMFCIARLSVLSSCPRHRFQFVAVDAKQSCNLYMSTAVCGINVSAY